ncbi:hypothetical protein LCGC14_0338050 [marine sediment metagenome]|uniref:Uncharacterized protein n=1 Tax=marine sediment metagenome TaxID=412755 RepID=A0A0F9W1P9_9ZZZZ
MFKILGFLNGARGMIQGKKTYIVATMAVLAVVNQVLGLGLEYSAGNLGLIAFGKQAWQLWLGLGFMTGAAKINRLANGNS